MTADELMIGNYVDFRNVCECVEVTEISTDIIGVKFNEKELDIEHDRLSPIPLTEEWLVKFGFVKSDDNRKFYRFYNQDFIFQIVKSNGIYVPYIEYEVNYVHQLQNIYKVHTQQNLTL